MGLFDFIGDVASAAVKVAITPIAIVKDVVNVATEQHCESCFYKLQQYALQRIAYMICTEIRTKILNNNRQQYELYTLLLNVKINIMNIDTSSTEVNITETDFKYGVMFKYNIISSADNIQYKITSEFMPK